MKVLCERVLKLLAIRCTTHVCVLNDRSDLRPPPLPFVRLAVWDSADIVSNIPSPGKTHLQLLPLHHPCLHTKWRTSRAHDSQGCRASGGAMRVRSAPWRLRAITEQRPNRGV